MELAIFNEKYNSKKKISFPGSTVNELLKQLKINPETVLVVRKGEVLTEEEPLQEKDKIDLLSVISGG